MRTYRFQQSGSLAHNRSRVPGFSLLEVLIAITVLVVGLTAMASLAALTMTGTERARYMGLATTLSSEKLEDVNRWPTTDPDVAAGGSLSVDTTVGTIDYFDDVVFSSAGGQETETISSKTAGVTTYVSTAHSANGIISQTSSATAPSTAGQSAFHRRWLIELNPLVNGITLQAPSPLVGPRRVTVEVTLTNQLGGGVPVIFQMSTVRP